MAYGETNGLSGAVATARRTVSDSVARLRAGSTNPKSSSLENSLPLFEARRLNRSGKTPGPRAVNDASPKIIAIGVEVTGSIAALSELHVYGAIKGNVRAPKVTICAGGTVNGDVSADTILIYGAVEGRLSGGDVRLYAGANVIGEISHFTLGIDVAANFEGSIKRVERPAILPSSTVASTTSGEPTSPRPEG